MDGRRTRRHLGASRLAVLLTVGVVGIVGLTACTGKHNPAPTSTTTASSTAPATTSPSPTATPPPAPKAAPTAKSAEAFVKYFWDVYNYSYATRNTNLLEKISGPKCIFCRDTIKAIKALSDDDRRVEGSEITLGVAVAPPTDPSAGLIVATIVSERPGRTTAADGSTVSRTKGVRNMKSEMALDWTGDRWIVRDLANDEETGKPW